MRKKAKRFSKEQLNYLKRKFKENKHPSNLIINKMGHELGCLEIEIFNWFANKRGASPCERLSGKWREPRTELDPSTVVSLNEEFEKNNHPNGEQMNEISAKYNLKWVKVRNWFYRRRKNQN